jgi:hypothetical protein
MLLIGSMGQMSIHENVFYIAAACSIGAEIRISLKETAHLGDNPASGMVCLSSTQRRTPMRHRYYPCLTLLVGLVLLVGSGTPCAAQEPLQVITTPQLKQWLASNQKPLLVYSLSRVEFYEQRIPGSVCIPAEEMQNSHDLPPKFDQPMVFYCLGPG